MECDTTVIDNPGEPIVPSYNYSITQRVYQISLMMKQSAHQDNWRHN